MFCYQCEQTANGKGCTKRGVCGKVESTADLQDIIVYQLKGLAEIYSKIRCDDIEVERAIIDGLFITVTNVNFDDDDLIKEIERVRLLKKKISDKCGGKKSKCCILNGIKKVVSSCKSKNECGISEYALFEPAKTKEELIEQAKRIAITTRQKELGEDIAGLQELLTSGLKGTAAYTHHARVLGKEDRGVNKFIIEALVYLTKHNPTIDELLQYTLKCGEVNLKAMELLDEANTSRFGHPEPTQIRTTGIKGKAILVSGHDLKDLETLLKQTEGKGVNIYTHGEMLPCLAYPGLKKYPHLVGNWGGAWQDQQKEFLKFPGAILMTTNCIQNPVKYSDKIFTTGLVGWEGVKHVSNDDFSPVINKALQLEGFKEDEPQHMIMTGFARNSVMNVAPKVIDAIKNEKIKHIFLIGGCDGAKSGRNYYTELATSVPEDCLILTLACGKYRFNKLDFGEVEGLPRLLDMGQCNDAYSAIKVAQALAKAFNCGVNDLPLSLILSWYEQKAVCILLTLLYLDIKNIRLGPSLPAYITPPVFDVLVKEFNIMPISTPDEDLKAILG